MSELTDAIKQSMTSCLELNLEIGTRRHRKTSNTQIFTQEEQISSQSSGSSFSSQVRMIEPQIPASDMGRVYALFSSASL